MRYFLLKVFMRALFCYNPKEDRAIPCQEAGLPFKRRHILEVVSQDDPTWWQAKRVGDTNLRAGLIPSKQFQERFVNEDCRFLLFLLTNHMVSHVFVLLFFFFLQEIKGRIMPCLEDSARRFRIPQLYNELPSFLRVVSSWFVLCSMRTEALAIEVTPEIKHGIFVLEPLGLWRQTISQTCISIA